MRGRLVVDERMSHVNARDFTPPPKGWVRAVRDALGMSTRQMAVRCGVSHTAIAQLERSEVSGTARIDTLRRAADALDCDLVYALVPRVGLQETVRRQSVRKAQLSVALADRTMRLEDQGLSRDQLERRVDALALKIVDSRSLWDERDA